MVISAAAAGEEMGRKRWGVAFWWNVWTFSFFPPKHLRFSCFSPRATDRAVKASMHCRLPNKAHLFLHLNQLQLTNIVFNTHACWHTHRWFLTSSRFRLAYTRVLHRAVIRSVPWLWWRSHSWNSTCISKKVIFFRAYLFTSLLQAPCLTINVPVTHIYKIHH